MADVERILSNLVREIVKNEGINNPEYKFKAISTGGANFTSSLHLITIKSSDRPDLELFAKVACLGEQVRELLQVDTLFDNERYVYEDLAQSYDSLQEKNNIPEQERFTFPKFYVCDTTHMEESVVLENLAAKGYLLYDRLKPITWEYGAAAVGELAKFHALSFAFKEEKENQEEFHYVIAPKTYVLLHSKHSKDEMIKMYKKSASNSIQMFPKEIRDRLEKAVDKYLEKDTFVKFYEPFKHLVLVHGDYRASNLLYKRKNGKLDKLIPVDYQTWYCGSGVTDLLYFIFSGTDGEFRRLHYKRLIDHYYNTFATFLGKLGHNANKLYSREDFNEELKEKLPFGLLLGLAFLPGVLMEADNVPKMDGEENLEDFEIKMNGLMKQRIGEIVDDFIKWRVL